ncbi:hypothetical protein [Roseicella aquatilis]|uniref:hypothetical protein n=1 Tax=Roseicella aquatilis TaxID=2527868 RepID=UPI001404C6BB|nr:hypothetical protein [Roseicella aquatilis]
MVRRAVVPRLALSHGAAGPAPGEGPAGPAWAERAQALAATLPTLELAEASRALRLLNPAGACFEAICRDVLLPAATRLRRQRREEGADQAGYLMGIWRLRMLLIGLEDAGHVSARAPQGGASALLVADAALAPTLEHMLVQRLFRRAGWAVRHCGCRADAVPVMAAGPERVDLAWFSIDEETDIEALTHRVAQVRRAACNQRLRILSGWLLACPPPPAAQLGADAVTDDAVRAVALARELVTLH